jgi:hypothetical protein
MRTVGERKGNERE